MSTALALRRPSWNYVEVIVLFLLLAGVVGVLFLGFALLRGLRGCVLWIFKGIARVLAGARGGASGDQRAVSEGSSTPRRLTRQDSLQTPPPRVAPLCEGPLITTRDVGVNRGRRRTGAGAGAVGAGPNSG